MKNTKKKWYLLLVEDMTKDETQITIKKTQLISSDMARDILDTVDNIQEFKMADFTRCKKCIQYSNGTCLVFSVNVKKYGRPKECTLQ